MAATIALSSSAALADRPTPRACTEHPCPGYAYEVVYRLADGDIVALSAYDPCGPPYYDCQARRPTMLLEPGEAWLNIAGDPRVREIMENMDDFSVDLRSLTIVRKPQVSSPASLSENVESGPTQVAPPQASGGISSQEVASVALAAVAILLSLLVRSSRSRE